MEARESFKQINLLFYALLAGQLLFCAVLVFMMLKEGTLQTWWPDSPFDFVAPTLIAGAALMGLIINKNQLPKGIEQTDLPAKVTHYRNLVIMRCALVEGANLSCLVMLLMEKNAIFLILFAAGLLIFLKMRPSIDEFLEHYRLSSTEKAAFNFPQ